MTTGGTSSSKATLRRTVLRRRQGLDAADVRAAGVAIASHLLEWPALCDARVVGAYVSFGSEPPTGPLLDALRKRGTKVLLPVVLPDLDLTWVVYTGTEALAPRPRGPSEPTGRSLGPEAITDVDVVVVPGLAADGEGHRLGRGGGSYDRALARVGAEVPRVIALYDGELVDDIPHDGHDESIDVVVTPSALTPLGRLA
ncbi:MAG: 5-formyltetrahydrofolate cyclo-ligase [Nocardioidaceae bacterium]